MIQSLKDSKDVAFERSPKHKLHDVWIVDFISEKAYNLFNIDAKGLIFGKTLWTKPKGAGGPEWDRLKQFDPLTEYFARRGEFRLMHLRAAMVIADTM